MFKELIKSALDEFKKNESEVNKFVNTELAALVLEPIRMAFLFLGLLLVLIVLNLTYISFKISKTL